MTIWVQLKKNQLPREIDIIKYFYFLKGDSRSSPDRFFNQIIETLKEIWDRAFIPYGNDKFIRGKLATLFNHDKFKNLDKDKNKISKDQLKSYRDDKVAECSKLFKHCSLQMLQ